MNLDKKKIIQDAIDAIYINLNVLQRELTPDVVDWFEKNYEHDNTAFDVLSLTTHMHTWCQELPSFRQKDFWEEYDGDHTH